MTETNTPFANLIPRGSLGLKLLLVCILVLAMGVPLLLVGAIQDERQGRARSVTAELGARFGGDQVVGGPMLLVPYQRPVETTDEGGRTQRRIERGNFLVFAETGSAETILEVGERHSGIYRAAIYTATTDFDAAFSPAAAVAEVSESVRFNWNDARVVMLVHDTRAIRDAIELRFADGSTAALEPMSELRFSSPGREQPPRGSFSAPVYFAPSDLLVLGAPAPFAGAPRDFTVETRLVLTGAQSFALAAFAQNTTAIIRGDRTDARAQGHFQTSEALAPDNAGFVASWSVPYVARGVEKAADVADLTSGEAGRRDMEVSFVAIDDIYVGVARAIRYGIMFIGIVFLATLIFEAVSGKKAHPAQYILVGLAQCVFYLLLLAITEHVGFTPAFFIAASPTVALLAFYAGASFRSAMVGWRALAGLALLYGAMYVLMTLEDYALLAGSVTAFIVIAATMIATRGVDWYGRSARKEAASP